MTTDKNELSSTKSIIITGANSGIGYFTTLNLAKIGHKVIMICRNEEKAIKAKNDILNNVPNANLDVFIGDLSSI